MSEARMPKTVIWVTLIAVGVAGLPHLSGVISAEQRDEIIVSADTPSKSITLAILAPVN
ncbi:MAG: hypothetical protein GY947_19555 [Rhodobacteraceae bacterium]|nr:hypothetical protein [Paracoccaceae bacterium]